MICLRLLGSLDLRDEHGEPIDAVLRRPKLLALLAYLAIARPRGFHRRDKLIAMFWPESSQERARHALRQAIYVLRRELGEEAIVTRGDEEVGVDREAMRWDVVEFETALQQSGEENALEFYRGDLLDGFFISDAPDFERWVDGERVRLRAAVIDALWELFDRDSRKGDARAAAGWRRRLVELAPEGDVRVRQVIERQSTDPVAAGSRSETIARREVTDDAQVRDSDVRSGPATASHPVSAARNKRWFVGTLGAALVVLAASALYVGARNGRRAYGNLEPNLVAVFPAQVTGPDSLRFVGEAMAVLLYQALDGAGELRAVDPNVVIPAVHREEEAANEPSSASTIAVRLGARYFALSRVVVVDEKVRAVTSLYDATVKEGPLTTAEVEAELRDILSMTEELAQNLLLTFPAGRGVRLASICGLPPNNYAALKAYLEGESHVRGRDYPTAVEAFDRAIALDSSFSLAWYRRAVATSFTVGSRGPTAQAMVHDRRLCKRDRAFLETFHAFHSGEFTLADSASRTLVSTYPRHVEAWWLRGISQQFYHWARGVPMSVAREAFERALDLDPGHRESLWNLSWVASTEGRYREADSLFGAAFPKGEPFLPPLALARRAETAFALGREDAQREILAELVHARDAEMNIAVMNVANGAQHLAGASRIATVLTDSARRGEEAQLLGHLHLALLEAGRGRLSVARTHFARADELGPGSGLAFEVVLSVMPSSRSSRSELVALRDRVSQWRRPRGTRKIWPFALPEVLAQILQPYLMGLISARLGQPSEAHRFIAEIEAHTTPLDSVGLVRDLSLEVRALARIEREEYHAALGILESARLVARPPDDILSSSFSRRWLGRLWRAELLFRLGRDDAAASWFGTFGTFWGTDYVFYGLTHLRRGELYERLGNPPRALHHYERFLELWGDADPQYGELVDGVRQRVSTLSRRR